MTTQGVSLREYLARSRAVPFAIGATILGVFLTTVVVSYAFTDDYSLLWMADSGEPSAQFGKTIVVGNAIVGRPLAGLLVNAAFHTAGTIDNLRFLRLLAVVAIVALALLLDWALVRSGLTTTLAALIAVLVCSLPAFQVYASWATIFVAPYAALLGAGASLLAVAAIDGPRELALDRVVGASTLLLAALLTYQPAAMFFWVFLAVALVGARHEARRALRLVRTHAAVAGAALPLAYLVIKVTDHYLATTPSSRNALTHDVLGKARWFVGQPLYRSLNLFDLTPSLWFAAFVATVATAGILLWLGQRATRPLLYATTGVILIPLCYLPNLVVRESWASYRTQVSLSSLLALYGCLGAIGIWVTCRDWLRPRFGSQALAVAERFALAAFFVFVATSAFLAARNVSTLFVEPQVAELRMLRTQVAAFPTGASRVAIVQTGYHQGLPKLEVYDEFGIPSLSAPWAMEPAVLLALREERPAPVVTRPIVDVVDVLQWYTTTLPKNEPVIDLRGIRTLR